MDIDQEHLGIPDTEFDATVQIPSAEFMRICRDMAILGETLNVVVNKEGKYFLSFIYSANIW